MVLKPASTDISGSVASFLGTEHTKLIITPLDALQVIPKMPSVFDEPFADSSQIPTFLVSEFAKQKVTVALSGDAGDELFGGYNRHRLIKVSSVVSALANLLNNIFPEMLRKYQRLDRLADIFIPRLPPWRDLCPRRVRHKNAQGFAGANCRRARIWDDPGGLGARHLGR